MGMGCKKRRRVQLDWPNSTREHVTGPSEVRRKRQRSHVREHRGPLVSWQDWRWCELCGGTEKETCDWRDLTWGGETSFSFSLKFDLACGGLIQQRHRYRQGDVSSRHMVYEATLVGPSWRGREANVEIGPDLHFKKFIDKKNWSM